MSESAGATAIAFFQPTSKMTMKMASQGRTDTTTMETKGKWLKADCGNVKPMPVPKK